MENTGWLAGLFIVAFGLDILLSWLWQPFYFRYGLPLFGWKFEVRAARNLAEVIPEVVRQYRVDVRPIIEFCALGPDESAFQEQVFRARGGLTYPSLIHGFVYFDSFSQHLVVIGFTKLYVVLALGAGIVGLMVNFSQSANVNWLGVLFRYLIFLAVLIFCYAIQAWRYYHVGKTIQKYLQT